MSRRKLKLQADNKGYYIFNADNPTITPEAALEIFVHHNYSGQRDFDQAHANNLAKNVQVCPDIDLAIGPDGKAQIVNGQHSIFAIYLRGRTTQIGLKIWARRDEKSIADLFAIFDDNKKRTLNNAIHAAKQSGGLSFQGRDGRLAKWSMASAVAKDHTIRPELARAVEDALTGIVWRDDSQIVDEHLIKCYSDAPGVRVIVRTKGTANGEG